MAPRVTVVMAMRNAALTLPAALTSLRLQTLKEWELILIDDGSCDRSVEVARRFGDHRMRLIVDGRKQGLPSRLNRAIASATAPYIARFDADDICYPERLEHQIAFLEAHPEIDLVGSGAVVFSDDGRALGMIPVRTSHGELCSRPWAGFHLPHPTWCGRTGWFRRYRYNETALKAQDQVLLLRAYRCSRLAAIEVPLLGYRQQRVGFGKVLRGRYHFSRALVREAYINRAPSMALRGLAGQGVKAVWDAVAVASRPLAPALSRRMHAHRALPLPTAYAGRWAEVWCAVSAAVAAKTGG